MRSRLGRLVLTLSLRTNSLNKQTRGIRALPFAKICVVFCAVFALALLLRASLPEVAVGAWVDAGRMSVARSGAASVLLPDGRIMLIGGNDGSGNPVASTEFFNLNGTFTPGPEMVVPRMGHTATSLKTGDVLVTGGVSAGGAINSAEVFSPSTGTWRLVAGVMSDARTGHMAARLPDGNVLIVGGQSGGAPLSSIELFIPETEQFNFGGSLITARKDAAISVMPDGRTLIAGGIGNIGGALGPLASTEIYTYDSNTGTGTVVAGPNMASARSGAAAAPTYDGVAVIGGNDGTNDLGTAEIFSQWTNTFKMVAGATPRSNGVAVLLPYNGSVLVTGGTAGASVDLLQPWLNNRAGGFVSTSASLYDHTAGVLAPLMLNGLMLAAGGNATNGNTSELFRFPTIATDKTDYAPGTTVVMTGSGFQPGEIVYLHMHQWSKQNVTDYPDYTVTADADGGFTFSGYAPTVNDIDTRYHLTALGASSGLQAQTVFTDAANKSIFSDTNNTTSTTNFGTVAAYACRSSYLMMMQGGNLGTDSINRTATLSSSPGSGVTFYAGAGCSGSPVTSVTVSAGTSSAAFSFKISTPGSYTITGAGSWDSSSSNHANATVSATKANQTITVTTAAPSSAAYNYSFPVAANSTSGLSVEITTTGGCSGSGSDSATITMTSSTTSCVVHYNQPGNASYNAAPEVTSSTTATKADQTITFGALSTKTYGDADFAVSATGGGSGNPVAFSSSTTSVCTTLGTNGATVHIVSVGTCTIRASQNGDTNYNAAPNVDQSFTIGAKQVTANITAANKTYDGNKNASVLCSLTGVVSPDTTGCAVSANAADNQFIDKNVGTGKTVTANNLSLTNNAAGNYTLASTTATTTADITALHATGSFTAANKVYNGTTAATVVTRTVPGAISGDIVSLEGGTAAFDTKNVGTGKTVTLSGASLTGSDSTNYFLDSVSTTTADITALHVTGGFTAANKTYDGTRSASILTRSLPGAISGDIVSLEGGTAAFDTKNVGTGKTVTLSGASLTGSDSTNYFLDSVSTTTADITPLHITGAFTANNKVYDGTNTAIVQGRTLAGVISADVISLTGGTATFADKNVGSSKTVTLAGAILDGDDAGNYVLDSVSTATADITPLHVTGAFTASTKVYDGNTGASVLTRTLSTAVSGDDISLIGGTATFDTKNVGTGKVVTLSGASLSGGDVSNYFLDSVSTTTADITPLGIVASVNASNKVYDGTVTATIAGCTLAGYVSGDDVICSGGTATFDNKNVGTGKTVTATGLALTGGDAGNYTVNSSAATAANITARPVTGNFTAASKTYDGVLAANVLTRSLTNTVTGDDISLFGGTAAFDTKNVGTGKTVTLSGSTLAGIDAGNYDLMSVNTTTADITPLGITGAITAANKVYDGTTAATVTGCGLTGQIGSDNVTCSGGTATFSDKNVGTGKTVTSTGLTLAGTDAGNYTVNSSATTTANITARDLQVTATGINKTYDGTTTATVNLADDRISGDVLTFAYSASFDTKNVGNAKPVSVSNIATSGGADAGNYHVQNTTASTSANITARALNVAATGSNKTYDGTATATVTLTDDRLTGDLLTLAYASASFADPNAGSAKPVSITGIAITGGADQGNYYLSSTTASAIANIIPRDASVTPNPASKVFGTADPAPLTTGTLTGFLAGDSVTATYSRTPGETVGTYQINATLSPTAVLGNYNITYNTANFSITAWTLTGFYQPVTPYSGTLIWNTVKGGSTVPIKFNIYAGTEPKTNPDTDVMYRSIVVYKADCFTAAEDPLELPVTNSGSTSLRYDSTAGQFIQNWQTPKGANCYLVQLTAADGSKLQAYFKAK